MTKVAPYFICGRMLVMKKIIFIISMMFCMVAPMVVFATSPTDGTSHAGSTNPGAAKFPDPLSGKGPQQVIGNIISAVLGVTGSIALAMFVYGGLLWMTAAGASDRVQKGKDVLIWATIGLIVIFSSFMLVKFVIGAIAGGGSATVGPDVPPKARQ